jgi:hypothetical protein
MPNNSTNPYKFVDTGEQREQLKKWAERAGALGITAEFVAASKTVHHHLTMEPLSWGDPCYRLSHLGLQVYQRACLPLHVTYAVDEARRIVYIMKFTPYSGSGLEQDT